RVRKEPKQAFSVCHRRRKARDRKERKCAG
ncbi:hypothetical protein TSPI_08764, partial [Trichinella spiralis]